ncbi:hypothetical protein [Ornithinimicrobium tianjinense]|uniref:Uncharacterized protein n=1 Tax=Ornithinimicrobium tianjinense TaxID=1195761 RepID=A0A917F3F6_9MICO|nr:hypothetical protein [Ornithinimicrobium tianjinense]GGF49169.1 hypothetical protein GCM10011366_16350 [Ornithinimicrobium tianjinense]
MSMFRRRGAEGEPVVTKPERSADDVPQGARAQLGRGEQLLASAQEDATGHWLLLTTWRLLERTEGGETQLERPWHEVDAGAWNPETWMLAASFVDGIEGRQWSLQRLTGPGMVPEVFRERTSASVVLARVVDLGPRRSARVTVRNDLRTRELVEQVLLGRGSRQDDVALAEQVLLARQELRGQVGMDPTP